MGIGFLAIPEDDHVHISEEHTDYKWVNEEELKATLDPHIFNDIKEALFEYDKMKEYKEIKESEHE